MRPSVDQYFIAMAKLVATRSTCPRRQVGCVAIDRYRHVLATGYNGVPSGIKHCIDHPCAGAHYPSGEGLEFCEAIHAEQNMLLQCPDVMAIDTIFVTASPCNTCLKMLMNTGVNHLVFDQFYPTWEVSRHKWEATARTWRTLSD